MQGDKTGDAPLSNFVKNYIKEKHSKPGEVFLGTVHRIDRPTSGIVLFARTSKSLARLNEMFKTKEIKKTYWAIVKNKPKKESDYLTHYLKKNERQNKSYASEKETPDSLRAELEYKIVCSTDNYHLLEVKLHTGRQDRKSVV